MENNAANLSFGDVASFGYRLEVDGSTNKFNIISGNQTATNKRFSIDRDTGDISFYEDTGTTPKFFWDASAEFLGIGTSSPATLIEASGSSTSTTTGISSPLGLTLRNTDTTDGNYTTIQNRDGNGDQNAEIKFINLSHAGNTGAIAFTTRSATGEFAEKVRISHTGNVGIGTESPSTFNASNAAGKLVVGSGSGNEGITVYSGTTSTGALCFADGTTSTDTYKGYVQYNHNTNSMQFATGHTERMRIDSSGNVGIGCTPSPWFGSKALEFGFYGSISADSVGSKFGTNIAQNAYASSEGAEPSPWKYITSSTNARPSLYQQYDGGHYFSTAATGTAGTAISWSESMRIDSSGHLLVGTTDTAPATNNVEGIVLRSEGHINVSRASGVVGYFNRKTNDGTILDFRKDGTAVGSIGTGGDGGLFIHSPYGADSGIVFASEIVAPCTSTGAFEDGVQNLGYSSARWKDLYLSGGVVFGTTGGSVSSKTLDDYEEGTFTPTFTINGSTGVGSSYTTQTGVYT